MSPVSTKRAAKACGVQARWALSGLALLCTQAALAAPSMGAVKLEFSATPAATTEALMLRTYSTPTAWVTFADGGMREFPMQYSSLFKNTDPVARVAGKVRPASLFYDHRLQPILDPNGDPVIAETADATRLLLINHWEYDDVPANGETAGRAKGWYRRMPMGTSLSEVKQSRDGALSVVSQRPIDFSSLNGGWIFCFGSQTPWNTHLDGEEDHDLYFVPGEKDYKTRPA